MQMWQRCLVRHMSTSLSERGVAFVGLGTMGRGMALNVAKQVQPLLLFDIDATAVSTVISDAQDTAAVLDQAKSLAELSRQSSLIVLCLPDGETVEEVVSKEMLPFLKPDSLVVDASTTSPETSRHVDGSLCSRALLTVAQSGTPMLTTNPYRRTPGPPCATDDLRRSSRSTDAASWTLLLLGNKVGRSMGP